MAISVLCLIPSFFLVLFVFENIFSFAGWSRLEEKDGVDPSDPCIGSSSPYPTEVCWLHKDIRSWTSKWDEHSRGMFSNDHAQYLQLNCEWLVMTVNLTFLLAIKSPRIIIKKWNKANLKQIFNSSPWKAR